MLYVYIIIESGSSITVDNNVMDVMRMVAAAMELRLLLLGRKAMTNLDSVLKSRHRFANKGLSSQNYGFSSSHVLMWELYHKEGWAPKNGCLPIIMLEKTLECPLGLQDKTSES